MLSRSSDIKDLSKVPIVKAPEEEPILSGLSNEKKESVHEMQYIPLEQERAAEKNKSNPHQSKTQQLSG